MESRTTGPIHLGPTGNIQGLHKFFSLNSGEIINRRNWIELPVPSDVINSLNVLTKDKEIYLKEDCEEEEDITPEEVDTQHLWQTQ